MKKVFIAFSCMFSGLYAQNLILNPGFEEGDMNYTSFRSVNATTYWEIPQIGVEDLFRNYQTTNSYLAGTFDCKVKKGVFHGANAFPTAMYNPGNSWQGGWTDLGLSPYTEAYEGSKALCLFWWLRYCPEKRSYVSIRLSEPLEKGKHYLINFKMTSGYSYQDRWVTNGLGIYISNHRLIQPEDFLRIDAKPQIELEQVFYDTTWKDMVFKFTADSNYQFLHIGNFRKTEDLKIDSIQKEVSSKTWVYYPLGYNGAYCFIDDVHVEPYDANKHLIKLEEFDKSNSTTQSTEQTIVGGKDSLVIDKTGNYNRSPEKQKKITIEIPEDDTIGYLVMKAHNVGSIPPNTSLLRIMDGKKEHIIQLSSTLKRSGTLELIFAK
jgi:hypothetical protein